MLLTNNNFQDLPVRVFSALVFGILAISSIVSGGLIFTLFLSSSVAIITWEIFNIFNGGTLTIVNSRLIIPVMMFFVPFFQYYNFYPLTVLVLVASTTVIFKEGRWLKSLCIFYIGVSVLTCQSLLFTSSEIPSFYHLLLVLTVVAGSDIGGYFFGRIIGGTKFMNLLARTRPGLEVLEV
jgi:CDP-diglyceride synthetase